jgi:single-stranded DNA-binding protein
VEAGRGPHVAAAVCASCGTFLKWLPKVLVAPLIERKETHLMSGVNRVVLLGNISKYGVEVRYAPSGTPCASFTLVLSEQGQDGKEHQTLVDCECWGKKAEAAGECEAGQAVLFEGKLRKRQKTEGQWEMIVSGFEVTPVLTPAASLTGNPN